MQNKGGDRVAMSRALGAAFLNHQVEQLEKSVVNRGPNSGNWRDHRPPQGGRNGKTVTDGTSPRGLPPAKRAGAMPNTRSPKKRVDGKQEDGAGEVTKDRLADTKYKKRNTEAKDADTIIIDASVLIHALGQLKKWCRADRKEVVVVPLEALNTLDLLKKGTSSLSQRARAASRVLEAQVGTNSRICVQRDDAFVSWEDISFKNIPAPNPLMGTPEWLRRTISCARWEAEHRLQNPAADNPDSPDTENKQSQKKVVFAVVAQPSHPLASDETTNEPAATISPVPLPTPHANKFEPRTTGTLVAYWAARAGVELYEVQPTTTDASEAVIGRKSDEDDGVTRAKKQHPAHIPGSRNRVADRHVAGSTPAGGGPGLVERPPAVKTMMEMVAQPTRVVRVLARGEKLDPET